MQIAMIAAGFTPARPTSCAARWRRSGAAGTIHKLKERLHRRHGRATATSASSPSAASSRSRASANTASPRATPPASRCWSTSRRWLKCHHPEVFAAALLNSQPMGFYAPAQLVRDAREHGVEVRPPDVNASDWDCTLETDRRTIAARCASASARSRASPKTTSSAWSSAAPALSRSGRPVAALRAHQAPDRGAGARRRLRLDGTVAPRRAVGGARLLRCASCRCSTARPSCATSNRRSALPSLTLGEQVVDDYWIDLDVAALPSAGAAAADASPSAAWRRPKC